MDDHHRGRWRWIIHGELQLLCNREMEIVSYTLTTVTVEDGWRMGRDKLIVSRIDYIINISRQKSKHAEELGTEGKSGGEE